MKKYLYPALIVLFSAIFLFSAVQLVDYFIKSQKQKDQYDELSNLVQQVQGEVTPPDGNSGSNENAGGESGGNASNTPISTYMDVKHPVTGETVTVLREYALIFEMNPDTVGWIKMNGGKINYPVLQTPDRPNYYLDKDFYGKSSKHGAIYANEKANLDTPSDNVTLYGHKMRDGSMFASLHDYKSEKHYKENPYITFDTLTEHHTYQIFAVFRTTAIIGEGFTYHTFVDGNVATFPEFVATCKELSLYDTGVEVEYGDKLLTLSTCDHSVDYGRFVVVAKRIS